MGQGRQAHRKGLALALLLIACGDDRRVQQDAALARDAAADAMPDASNACLTQAGETGACIDMATCAAMADRTSEVGDCPGPAAIRCCFVTPNVADNPPIPPGYKLMMQSEVTPEMTTWAVMILHDPVTYPMFSTTTMLFGSLDVLARVEWHPPDFNNSTVHRGVTLYEPV